MDSTVVDAVREPCVAVRREIDRFLESARQRSEHDGERRRRRRRRHHRSWPLLVSMTGRPFEAALSAALHNACEQGIAFLSPVNMLPGSTIYLKLFAHDNFCPRVPATIKHVSPCRHGYLVGCEFADRDAAACVQGLALGQHSRPHRVSFEP